MRITKLTGRECSILHAIGFTESMLGAEIQDFTHMKAVDVAEVLNGLMTAKYVESIPYCEQIELAEMPANGVRSERGLRPRLKERGFAVLRRTPAF
jgi:hypothetical protein